MPRKKAPPKTAPGETKEDVEAKAKPEPPKPVPKGAAMSGLNYVDPKELKAVWSENTSRALIHKDENGKPCCYTVEDVKDLIDPEVSTSLLKAGQKVPITVYKDTRGKLNVLSGFRRYYAFTLLHKEGLADRIPHSRGGQIAYIVVPRPSTEEEWYDAAMSNLAENAHRGLSELDLAYVLRRFTKPATQKGGQFGLGPEKAGELIAPFNKNKVMKKRTVARYLQVLTMSKNIQSQVHAGELSVVQACNGAADKGSRAKARGVPHAKIRGMLEDGRFEAAIAEAGDWGSEEVLDLVSYISGHKAGTKHTWFKQMV